MVSASVWGLLAAVTLSEVDRQALLRQPGDLWCGWFDVIGACSAWRAGMGGGSR